MKPTETDTIMHIYNRISGSSCDFPFGNPEKEQFLRRLRKLNQYYVIDLLASQVMETTIIFWFIFLLKNHQTKRLPPDI